MRTRSRSQTSTACFLHASCMMPSSDLVDCIIWNENLVLWGNVPSDNAPSSERASARQVRCMKISKSRARRVRCMKISKIRARIAQSVEHQTFNLRVQGSSSCSGDPLMFTFLHYAVFLNLHFPWLSMTCSTWGQKHSQSQNSLFWRHPHSTDKVCRNMSDNVKRLRLVVYCLNFWY